MYQSHSFLFTIINAAITPGTQPHSVNINVIKKEPHPLSTTANGGKMIAIITLSMLMMISCFLP